MSHQKRIEDAAYLLIREAQAFGFDLEITKVPLKPLAMGNHTMEVEVTPNNGKYRANERHIQIQNLAGECQKRVCDDMCSYPMCIGEVE